MSGWRAWVRRAAALGAALTAIGMGGVVAPATGVTQGATTDGKWRDQYAALLERHTTAVDATVGTRVDYRGLLADPAWARLVATLSRTEPDRLEGRAAKLAYWIDVYNIFAIDLVLRHYPIESIRDIGSWWRPVWKREAGVIDGESYSLDRIEHEILRPLGEPLVHAAIVCASVSCPDLRREPYRAERIQSQLADNMRVWLARPEKGLAIDRARRIVTLSPIFEWFEGDFGGRAGVLEVVTRHAPEAEREWLRENAARVEIETFDYDWSLND